MKILFQYHSSGHGLEEHNQDRKNNRKGSVEYVLLYPGCPTKILGNTLYCKLYLNDQIVQNYQVKARFW